MQRKPKFRNFLFLLLENRRVNLLVEIADYIRENYAHQEAQNALLKTTYPLELEVIQKLKTGLETALNKKLNLYLELDPTLLGGVQVVIGSMIIDGSVRKRIEEAREKLRELKKFY